MHEEIYLNAYDSVRTARCAITQYLEFYNSQRSYKAHHQATPDDACFASLTVCANASGIAIWISLSNCIQLFKRPGPLLYLLPVFTPHPRCKRPWLLDKQRYLQRNEVKRLFQRIKAYRRLFTRDDKLDVMYATFVSMALIC